MCLVSYCACSLIRCPGLSLSLHRKESFLYSQPIPILHIIHYLCHSKSHAIPLFIHNPFQSFTSSTTFVIPSSVAYHYLSPNPPVTPHIAVCLSAQQVRSIWLEGTET